MTLWYVSMHGLFDLSEEESFPDPDEILSWIVQAVSKDEAFAKVPPIDAKLYCYLARPIDFVKWRLANPDTDPSGGDYAITNQPSDRTLRGAVAFSFSGLCNHDAKANDQ